VLLQNNNSKQRLTSTHKSTEQTFRPQGQSALDPTQGFSIRTTISLTYVTPPVRVDELHANTITLMNMTAHYEYDCSLEKMIEYTKIKTPFTSKYI